MDYIKIILQAIIAPQKTFTELRASDKTIKYGWLTVISFALLYTLTVYSFHRKNLVPLLEYFLPVTRGEYYYYQSFITAPVTIAGVMINYQVIQFFLKRKTIMIDYKKLWGPISIASILPSFFILWFVETIFIVTFNWNHFTFDIIRISVGMLWTIALTIEAIATVDSVKKETAAKIGMVSSLLMLSWWGLFFR